MSFSTLQSGMLPLWMELRENPRAPRTVLAVPSLSLDLQGMAAPSGLIHFEERMLYLLNLLRNPSTQLIMVTSIPVPDSLIAYHLHFLPNIPYSHARSRLRLFSTNDWSERPLTAKILDRPILVERLRRCLAGQPNAYLTCYKSTPLEMELCERLGLPILGTDPRHLHYGYKSQARAMFESVGLPVAPGRADLRTRHDLARAIQQLGRDHDQLVIKLNVGISGLGNATLPLRNLPLDDPDAILRALPGEARCSVAWPEFLDRFEKVGGLVEAYQQGDSVSVQLLINPDGEAQLMGTHEEIVDHQQVYVGCRLPARAGLLPQLHLAGLTMARKLASEGVTGRLDVDFMAVPGRLLGLDVNLRKGNTTYPLRTLSLLAGGSYDPERGGFRSAAGEERCYVSTDKLSSPVFAGLLPEDVIDIGTVEELHYATSSHTGAVFHMLGALSRYGRLGMTCIERTSEEAQLLYERAFRRLEEVAPRSDWLQ